MGIFDKFISAVSINDTDDYEEEEFYDEEDDVEAEAPKKEKKKGFFSRIMGSKDNEYEDEYDDEPVKPKKEEKKSYSTAQSSSYSQPSARYSKPAKPVSKVTPMRKRSGRNMEVFVIKPSNMEDTREIADTLLANCTVVLNLEGLDVEVAQRVIDFSSGACYSIDGSLQKVSNYIFILTPANVGISGDITDILSSSIPSMRSSY